MVISCLEWLWSILVRRVAIALHLIQLHLTHASLYRGCFLAIPFVHTQECNFLFLVRSISERTPAGELPWKYRWFRNFKTYRFSIPSSHTDVYL